MKRFTLTIAHEECRQCHAGIADIKIKGVIYADGRISKAVKVRQHALCCLSVRTSPDELDIQKAEDILNKNISGALARSSPISVRDPSQSKQLWDDESDHVMKPIFE